jgi:hypothetical protein
MRRAYSTGLTRPGKGAAGDRQRRRHGEAALLRGLQWLRRPHRIVGMTNSAPSFVPDGQRDVTVFVLV